MVGLINPVTRQGSSELWLETCISYIGIRFFFLGGGSCLCILFWCIFFAQKTDPRTLKSKYPNPGAQYFPVGILGRLKLWAADRNWMTLITRTHECIEDSPTSFTLNFSQNVGKYISFLYNIYGKHLKNPQKKVKTWDYKQKPPLPVTGGKWKGVTSHPGAGGS